MVIVSLLDAVQLLAVGVGDTIIELILLYSTYLVGSAFRN